MGETNRLNPGGDEPKEPTVQLFALDGVDVMRQLGAHLCAIPPEHAPAVIMTLCGVLAESIETDTWSKILKTAGDPCGHPNCDCHLYAARFIPELHELKVIAERKKAEARNQQGRGLN